MIRDKEISELMGRVSAAMVLLVCVPQPGTGETGPTFISQLPSSFQGSVPTGKAMGTALPLSLKEAIDRGLKYNLGLLESEQSTRASRAARLRSLSNLVPKINAHVSSTVEQVDLAAAGIRFPGVPTVVGPFGFGDARANLTQTLFDWSDIKSYKSSSQSLKASEYAYTSSRDLIVQATANAYLLAISDAALVDSIRAQVETARVLYQRTADQNRAGVVAAIDVLRARVELQTQRQRLIAATNQLAIDKLTLARVIGLPTGQEFTLTDAVPYSELTGVSLQEALDRAYVTRPDYASARAQVLAAELAEQAARAENYPSLSVSANYGDIGTNFAHSHGTMTFQGTLNIPIFQGTKVRADVLQADAALKQLRSEREDLRGKIDFQVRTALLNLKSAGELVAVAKSNIELASQTLGQAQDRFTAGVADNLEVVQAQESVADTNQSYIASVYSYNLAKVSLAQAIGIAEQSALQYLGVK